jgi:hypothetical protein
MSDLLADLITSLDGYGAAEGWPGWWGWWGWWGLEGRGCPDVALELVSSRIFDGRTLMLEHVPSQRRIDPSAVIPHQSRFPPGDESRPRR